MKSCAGCPYRTDSVPGYFGENDPKVYAKALHRDVVMPCHNRSVWKDESSDEVTKKTPCIGHLKAQRNSCKVNTHDGVSDLLAGNTEPAEEFLGLSFYKHHNIKP